MTTDTTTDTSTDTPAPVNDKGAFVFERFKKVGKARSTLIRLDKQDEKHAKDRLLHKGLINGNRPFNQDRLKANGQAGRCNVNFRQGEATRDLNTGAYWSMMNDVPMYLDVTWRDNGIDATQAFLWSMVVGEEYTEMIRSWSAWHYHLTLAIQEFLIPGVGAFHMKDPWTWKAKAVKRENMRFKTGDASNPEDLSILYIRDTMKPHHLWMAIDNAVIGKKMGWNVEAVQAALVKKYVTKDLRDLTAINSTMLEKAQAMFKNGEYGDEIDELEDLNIVWLYVQEPDGKISEYIFVEDDMIPDYLFSQPAKYDRLSQAVVPFFYTIGDGDVGSVRGLGNRMFGMIEYSNRLMCGIMDGAWLASSMVVQDQSGDNRVMTIERIGPITKLPNDVKPVQSSFAPQFGQLVQVKQMLELMQNNNNGVQVRSPAQGAERSTATATQYQMERDTQFSGQQVGNFYLYWRLLHTEIVKRLFKAGWNSKIDGYQERKAFIDRCVARGVPRDLLNEESMQIDIMESIGGGSTTMKKLTTNRIHAMSGELDEIGRQNALVDSIAAEVGYRRARRYILTLNRNLIPTGETSLAMLENNDMKNGDPVQVGTDQKHLLHCLTHIRPITETVQAYMQAAQQGNHQDPRTLLPLWTNGIQHIQEHVARMSTDPRYKGDVAMIEEAIAQLMPVVNAAIRIAQSTNADEQKVQQEQIAQMQAQPQMTPQMQIRLQQAQAEITLKAKSLEADMELKRAKAEQAMAIKDAAARQKMEIKAAGAGMMTTPPPVPQEEPMGEPPVE